MTDHEPREVPRLPVFLVTLLMNDEFAGEVITRALESYKGDHNSEAGDELQQVLRQHLRIPGFRRADLASPSKLRMTIMDDWQHSSTLVGAVLAAWESMEQELIAEVTRCLVDHEIALATVSPTKSLEFTDCEQIEVLEKWVDLSQESGAFEATRDEVYLATVLATGCLPVPDKVWRQMKGEDALKPKPETSSDVSHWSQLLSEIRGLAATDPAWDDVDAFIAEIQAIAEEKLADRASQLAVAALTEAITTFCSDLETWIRYFGMDRCECWDAVACAPDDVACVLEKIGTLRDAIADYGQLESRHPSTLAERRELHESLTSAEERVQQLYEELTALLMVPSDGDGDDREDEPPPSGGSTRSDDEDPDEVPEDETAENEPEEPKATASDAGESIEQQLAAAEPPIISEADEPVDERGQSEDVLEKEGSDEEEESEIELAPAVAHEVQSEEITQVDPERNPSELESASVESESEGSGELSQSASPKIGGEYDRLVHDPIHVPVTVLAQPSLDDQWDKADIDVEGLRAYLPDLKAINEGILERLDKGDLLAAYWLARAVEQSEREPLLNSWYICALQGAFWSLELWPEPATVLGHDLAKIMQQHPAVSDDTAAWFGAAAALPLAVLDPIKGWGDWLNYSFDSSQALNELLERVRAFSAYGWPLDPYEVEGVVGTAERESGIKEIAQEADQWLAHAGDRSSSFQRATAVWRHMVSDNGELFGWFRCVADDSRGERQTVEECLAKWMDSRWLTQKVHRVEYELAGQLLSPIQGRALHTLQRWVNNACLIAQRWCRAAGAAQKSASDQSGWHYGQVRSLIEELERRSVMIAEEVDELTCDASPVDKLGAHMLLSVLHRLRALWNQDITPSPFTRYSPLRARLAQDTLCENLMYRLLWYPELQLGATWLPRTVVDYERYVALMLSQDERDRVPTEVVRRWIASRDYRYVGQFLEQVDEADAIKQQVQSALVEDLRKLSREADETTIVIERAVVDGFIAEGERAEYTGQVEAALDAAGLTEGHVVTELTEVSLAPLFDKLHAVQKKLGKLRAARMEHQRARWISIKEQLAQVVLEDEKRQLVEQTVEKAVDAGEIRVITEYLAHLDDVLQRKALPSSEVFATGAPGSSALEEFTTSLEDILTVLDRDRLPSLARALKDNRPIPGFPVPRLPAPRLSEASGALEAWRELKSGLNSLRREEVLRHIATLMEYIGFQTVGNSPVSVPPSILVGHFEHWRVRARPMVPMPVPQFGSEREGIYDVVGIWERPGFGLVSSQLLKVGTKPMILFYFARLLPRQREDFLREAIQKDMQVLIIDEGLMLFLTREYQTRLRPMLECTLPYAAINPYVPFVAGSVPEEMFMGRDAEMRQLLDRNGPAILYGGRQLGKSALLKQVSRRFHNPREGQYAILEDIKSLGDPTSPQEYMEAFRVKLGNALKRLEILDGRRVNAALPTILESLHERIEKDNLSILLMLDEADHFLDADSERGFQLVGMLKSLMDRTNRRFRIVLSGLHNVQRFQRISNQPLAHLGTPIRIGPMAPDAARALLEQPLRALGYRFGAGPGEEDPSLVLHILSYTNYHPGLIQLFGHHLVTHLHNKYQSGTPPFFITRADVEQVYRRSDVRKAIRDRLNWTLALDARYEAIELAIILDQWEVRDGFDRRYTPDELLDLVSGWWPKAFGKDVGQDRFRGFLEEMQELGALAQVNQRYRLRSPNLVHLLGTYDDLSTRLLEISDSEPPTTLKVESHHIRLSDNQYSPLTYRQQSGLSVRRSGVSLVVGSQALGLRGLRDATKQLVTSVPGVSGGEWAEIQVASSTGHSIRNWFDKRISGRQFDYLVAYRRLLFDQPEEIYDQVDAALKCCRQYRKRYVHAVFELDPLNAWQWHRVAADERDQLEQQLNSVIWLEVWDAVGVKQRLEQYTPEIVASDRVQKDVMRITGGWPFLLDKLMSRYEGGDFEQTLDEYQSILRSPDSELRKQFIQSLGIPDGAPAAVLKVLIQEKEGWPEPWLVGLLDDIPPEETTAAARYLRALQVLHYRPDVDVRHTLVVDPVVAALWPDE